MMVELLRNRRHRNKKIYSHRVAFNMAALFVIGVMTLAPLEPVFAQSSTPTDAGITGTSSGANANSSATLVTGGIISTTSDSGTTTPSPAPTPSPTPTPAGNTTSPASSPTTDSTASPTPPPTPAAAPAFTPSGQTGPDIQPVVYNSFNQNQVKIDKNTGALNTSFPLDIPPGRNGVQPNLSLVYNSQNTQQGSIVGEGWSVSIPYIERLNKTGVDNLYSTSSLNYFNSSLDGEIISTTTVTSTGVAYVARTENGTFNQYAFSSSTNGWTMTDKNGTQYLFGSASSSEQSDPNNSSHIFRWMLKQVTDVNGNIVSYNYFKDSGQIYPSSTTYTNTSSTTGIFEVDFQRATSTDNATSSAAGFAVNSNYRVSEIDVRVNGTWVRKYVLGYTAGNNGTTALLGSIAESGQNASGTVVSLPSSTFAYQIPTTGWSPSSTWNPPTPFVAYGGGDNGVRAVDANGDALADIIASTSWANTGAGWTSSSTWNAPVALSSSGGDSGWRLVDLTGDGLPDLISASGSYLNTGSGWVSTSTWNAPIAFSSGTISTGAILVDANGDGLPDIISGFSNASGTNQYAAYLNTGHGWAASTIWKPPVSFVASGGLDNGTRIVDVNGDGLPDILSGFTDASGTAHYGVWMNTGSGWATSTVWNSPLPFMSNGGWDNGVRFADVNGDGLSDMISGYTDISGNPHYAAYLNTGHGWATSTSWAPPALFDTVGGYDGGARVLDVNGDGLPDIISGYTDSSSTNQFAAWINSNSMRADVLTGITYPQGGSSAIQYQAGAQQLSAGSITNRAPYPVYVVSNITSNDGSGNLAPTTYQYASGTYYYGSPTDHAFAGFGLVTQTDGSGNVTKTYYDTSNGNASSSGQYADNFWKIGKPFRVEQYDNASNLYKLTITKWDSASRGGNAAFVFPDQTLEMDYDGLGTHKDLAEAYTFSTSTGNETQKIQWGQVTGNTNGTFTDTGSDELITNNTYASSSSSSVIGKLSDEILKNQTSTNIQEAQYFYDNLGLGSVSNGNLTKQLDWKASSTYLTTVQNTYNGFGLVTQSLDPRNNTTTYSYDTYNLYPATTTNALNQATSYQYDYSTGKPIQTIDPNRLTFKTIYDGVGRVLQILQPDQVTTSTLDTKTIYTYVDSANAVSIHESDYLNATTTVDTYTYYDGLNRVIQARKSATDAGQYKVADTIYNNRGIVQKQSLPYFSNGSSRAAATTTASLFTSYTYDPLQRVLTTVNSVGTVSSVYTNWKTTTTDLNGNQKDIYDDAYGNLIQVGEHNATSTYTTTYTYDGLKDLLGLTDANGNIRSFVYDGLGRMVSSTDLRAPADATYGIWNYTYDDAGNVITRVDPKSQSVSYTYDGLNRVLTESLATSTQIAYTYDSCTNGVARLCTVSSTDAVSLTSKTYDPLGNLASETKTIGGTNYTTSYTYDRQGNQLTIANPDNSQIQYTYGTGGLVTNVQEKESGGSWSTIVTSFDYSPMDKVTTQVNANGVTTVNTYDYTRLYRLYSTVTTDNGGGFAGGFAMIGGGPFAPPPGGGGPSGLTYNCTSSVQSYTVPSNVTAIAIAAFGAQGGSGGGLGGEATGTLAVTSGTTYYFNVGCQSGYGGGGSPGGGYILGGNGGGMTWFSANSFFTTSTVLMIAGGGGGTGGQGNGGTGSPGSGGAAGGLTGTTGGIGSSGFGANSAFGGGGGTQSAGGTGGTPGATGGSSGANGAVGQGGVGGNYSGVYGAGGGGGGGGGFYGGGGGGGNGDNGSGFMGGGGGGGSSFIAATSYLTNTGTISGINSGDGSLTITPVGTVSLASPGQYHLDAVTPINEGSSTPEIGVVFGGTLNSSVSTTVQLQVEVEPAGVSFLNIADVTSSPFVAAGTFATTTFIWRNASYHWQARVVDTTNNSSSWQVFGASSTSTDFIIAVTSTMVASFTGVVEPYIVPSGVTQIQLTAYGAQGASPSGSGGLGGEASGTLSVTPGVTYYYGVGQYGANSSTPFGGGGSNGGGGMTWFSSSSIFSTSTAILVAGGGGGGGGQSSGGSGGSGGAGGWQSGGNGGTGTGGIAGGSGGTQTAGNAIGQGGAGGGPLGAGGPSGGGGGGGFWGGNGGQGAFPGVAGGGGGGGGSSYFSKILTNTSTVNGVNSNNGSLIIYQNLPAPLPVTTGTYTGAVASYTIPLAADLVTINIQGAVGSTGTGGDGNVGGGAGDSVTSTVYLTPGSVIYYNVGGQAGYNGGGAGGAGGASYPGASGGGMTWVSATSTFGTSTVLAVAGGGGGGGSTGGYANAGPGGNGAYPVGGSGGTGSFCTTAPTGGSQSSGGTGANNGSAGQGGAGGSAGGLTAGGGGGGGYYGGGGGSWGTSSGGACSGGGGSSYFAPTLIAVATSSSGGSNFGDGLITFTPMTPTTLLSSMQQYFTDGITQLGEGSSTVQGTVIFGATINPASSTPTSTFQLQVEVKPVGTSFANVANVSSSPFVMLDGFATTSFSGFNGGYHWQARWVDSHNNSSSWQVFGPMPASTDFVLTTGVTETYTGSIGSFTVPDHVLGLIINANGGQGGSANASGGLGGKSSGQLSVASGTTYYFSVGQQGGAGQSNNYFSSGGGGGGMTWFSASSTYNTSSSVIIVAGGGGGGGTRGSTVNCSTSCSLVGGTGGYGGGGTGGFVNFMSGGTGAGGGGYYGGNGGGGGVDGYTAGSGGTGGGLSAGSGSLGLGGTGGTQSSGYTQGQGQNGTNYSVTDSGNGGGGGSGYISTGLLINTSTSNGINSGDGSVVITEIQDLVPRLSSLGQFNGTSTAINEGSSTNQAAVTFKGTLNSFFAQSLQLQVEVEPTGTAFTNTPNVTSTFVAVGSVATATFSGINRGYHWQYRAIDAQNNTSTWQLFGPNSTSTDFVIAVTKVNFTFPTNGTSTPNFSNWQLNASNVTSTTNYQLNVSWDDVTGDPVQSSTINASGTALLSGVNVPKTTFVGDYTFDGDNVTMNATATLSAASVTVATTSVSFTEQTTAYPVTCGSTTIQCVTYRYDKNGNITQVIDNSATTASKTVAYTYDGLNRLLTASSSNAGNSQNYLQTFTYDPVGNILTGPKGTYSYAATGYTDPDAVTSIANGSTTSFTYDNDGNLTNASSGFTYTWDYNNHLLTAYMSGATSTYGYDYTGERVQVANGSTTTAYPEATYNINSAARTKNIFANGQLIATINNTTSTVNNAALVQQATSTVSSGTSISITLGSAPHSGDLLVLTLGSNPSSSSISSVSGGGVTWTKAAASNSNRDSEIWYGVNSSGSGTNVTSTLTTACAGTCLVNVSEWSGIATSNAVDATSTRHGSSVALVSSPTSTTANVADLIIATEQGTTSSILTAGPTGAFVALSTASSSNGNSAYDIVGATVTTSTSWTFTASTTYDSVIAAFKATTSTLATTTTSFVATDPLGGSSVITNATGTVTEVLDYYPYGGIRIDNTGSNYAGQQRKYIGQQYDAPTQLSYLNARYYNGSQGQFISQDPVFLAIGSSQLNQLTNGNLSDILSDPQLLNVYSYGRDNPITDRDPSGKLTQSQSAQISAILSQISTLLQNLSKIISGGGFGGGGYSVGSGNVGSTIATASKGGFSGINMVTATNQSYLTYNEEYAAVERSLKGKAYTSPGTGPDSFDCTGAVVYGIRQVANPNFHIGRGSDLLNKYSIPTNDTSPGTLNFYDLTPKDTITLDHVTTNLGGGLVLNPYNEDHGVVISADTAVSSYFTNQQGVIYHAQLNWDKIINQQ